MPGIVTFEDAETGEQIVVNTSARSTRAAYAHLMDKRRAQVEKLLRRQRIDSISLRTNQEYLPVLRTFFRQREHRLKLSTA